MSAISKSPMGKFAFKGFLNIDLTEADMQEFDYWGKAEIEDVSAAISDLLAGEYKLGLSWSTWADKYQVSATCKDPGSKYCGHCVTITHEHPVQGIVVMGHLYRKELVPGNLLLENEQMPIPVK